MTTQEPDRDRLRQVLSGGACPEPEALFRWHDRTSGQEKTDPIAEHLETCPRCQAELELLKEFETGEVKPDEQSDIEYVSRRLDGLLTSQKLRGASQSRETADRQAGLSGGWLADLSWRSWAGLAAALLLAVLYLNLPDSPTSRLSEVPPTETVRTGRLVLTSPVGLVPTAPDQFQWQEVPDAAAYRVVLEEVDGNVLWQAETPDSRIEVPGNVRTLLLPGKRVLWSVSARDERDRVVAESERLGFTVQVGGQP